MLEGFDQVKKGYVVNGFKEGFRLDFDESDQPSTPSLSTYNHASAIRRADVVSQKLSAEVAAGRMIGPSPTPLYSDQHNSPLALVEKKKPGSYRLIHNLSFPAGSSVNDQISKYKGSVRYQRIDDAIDSILELGPGCVLSKSDLEHAFKIIPVHGLDVPKLGIYWEGSFWCDLTLPMGCRTSCRIFEEFSSALEWILKNKGKLDHTHHVLDDFLLVSLPELADQQLSIFLSICKYLGIPVVVEKTASGTTLIFLGIELDTIKLEARLPLDKVQKCLDKIQIMLDKKSVTQLEVMSLAGSLNFACSVVRPGRPFVRRLYDLAMTAQHKYHHLKVSKSLREDLRLWQSFLIDFNGKTLFPDKEWTLSSTLHCYTDASKLGYGLVFGSHWAYGPFNQVWSLYNICLLEAYPIMLVFALFGSSLRGKKLILHSDNEALVTILNKQSSKDPAIMTIVRVIVLSAMKYNVIFKAEHIPGVLNSLADPLSRLQVELFKSRAHQVDAEPTQVPAHLLPENFSLT